MVQMQTNNSHEFCVQTQKMKSIYILEGEAHHFSDQGMIDMETKVHKSTSRHF